MTSCRYVVLLIVCLPGLMACEESPSSGSVPPTLPSSMSAEARRQIGQCTYKGFTYEVAVTVEAGRIVAIDVLNNPDTPEARKAEQVLERVIKQQSTEVDTVSGATWQSKKLLDAVQDALAKDPAS